MGELGKYWLSEMNEITNNLDIAVRLSLVVLDLEPDTKGKYATLSKLCKDALAEIERLRAENKKLRLG
jgi:hypothetical protein